MFDTSTVLPGTRSKEAHPPPWARAALRWGWIPRECQAIGVRAAELWHLLNAIDPFCILTDETSIHALRVHCGLDEISRPRRDSRCSTRERGRSAPTTTSPQRQRPRESPASRAGNQDCEQHTQAIEPKDSDRLSAGAQVAVTLNGPLRLMTENMYAK